MHPPENFTSDLSLENPIETGPSAPDPKLG